MGSKDGFKIRKRSIMRMTRKGKPGKARESLGAWSPTYMYVLANSRCDRYEVVPISIGGSWFVIGVSGNNLG